MAAKGWTMTAVAIAVAAGTYFTLETIYPPATNGDVDLRLVSPETVFGGELRAGAAADAGERPPAAVAEVETAPADPSGEPEDDTAALADGDLPLDGPADAVEPAVQDSLAADDDAAADDAAPAAVAPDAMADEADAAAGVDEPATTAATAATAAATATPAPTAAARPVVTPRPAAAVKATPAARLTQWWGPESDTRLSVVYAGSAAYTRAIVLMFNGPFKDASSAQQHLRVRDAAGKTVAGNWEVGASNRRMLLFPVARTGTYTVTVGGGLADQNGRSVGSPLQGPVRVQ